MHRLVVGLALAFFVFILWVLYVANTGGDSVFLELVSRLPHGDKLGHFCLFGLLTLVATAATRFRAFLIGSFDIYYGAALVSTFVIFEELTQAFIPNRTLDATDLAADSAGILFFSAVAWFAARRTVKTRDITVP